LNAFRVAREFAEGQTHEVDNFRKFTFPLDQITARAAEIILTQGKAVRRRSLSVLESAVRGAFEAKSVFGQTFPEIWVFSVSALDCRV
jgi:hypothetical protein